MGDRRHVDHDDFHGPGVCEFAGAFDKCSVLIRAAVDLRSRKLEGVFAFVFFFVSRLRSLTKPFPPCCIPSSFRSTAVTKLTRYVLSF